MSVREEFEAWIVRQPRWPSETEWAWITWQAVRVATIDECAKVADKYAYGCAAAIRALKEKP